MRGIIFIFLACCLGVSSLCYFAYEIGRKTEREEIIKRALEIEKECYTNQDIEIIIFGETQCK